MWADDPFTGVQPPQPRAVRYRGLTLEETMPRVVEDLDTHDRWFAILSNDNRWMKRLLIAVLLSTTTASILLVLNLIGGSGGGK